MAKKSEILKQFFFGLFCVCFCFGGILLLIVLLSLTVKSVEQTEYAVGYDTYNMKFTKIYTQGKYVTKVGEKLIRLPRTLQEYSTELTCLTNDKVLINLEIGMQYQYQRNKLIDTILMKFDGKEKFNRFIENRAVSSILDTCLKYNAEDYYTTRGDIDIAITNELVNVINNNNVGANVEFFQLINIGFPPSFSNAITRKQTVQQEALTATNNRQSILTNAETGLLEARRTALIVLINANNTALININKAYTNAKAQEILWTNRANAYGYASNVLKLNGTSMVNYIKSENVLNSNVLVTGN